jgi:hypothetical protein
MNRCASCNEPRPDHDLLEVVTTATGTVRYVCRPGTVRPACFGTVKPRHVERIAIADPREQARHPDPAAWPDTHAGRPSDSGSHPEAGPDPGAVTPTATGLPVTAAMGRAGPSNPE